MTGTFTIKFRSSVRKDLKFPIKILFIPGQIKLTIILDESLQKIIFGNTLINEITFLPTSIIDTCTSFFKTLIAFKYICQ